MTKVIVEDLVKLAVRVGEQLDRLELSLATAESCTGGWVGHVLTAVPTSSGWFERGFITYSDDAKIEMLGVSSRDIDKFSPVSEEVAIAMAKGAITHSKAHVSVAITGLAGPDKDDKSKAPIGTCWIAWSIKNQEITTQCRLFNGDRNTVNYGAVELALAELIHILGKY